MAASPAVNRKAKAKANASASEPGPGEDPTRALFLAFQARWAEHEHAVQHCDRLEAALVAEHGYPRVRLPGIADAPVRYAAHSSTITSTVPAGPRRDRLFHLLCRKQQRWHEAAFAIGLLRAREREEVLHRAVRGAAKILYATPATTSAGILCKLLVLLSLEAPGDAFQDASPWRELEVILADLQALVAGA